MSEASDAANLRRLAAAARAEIATERDGPIYLLADAPEGPELGNSVTRACWVGCVDGHVVGYASARLDPLPNGQQLAVLEEVFVELEARHVSIGELLVGQVVAWATDAGAVGVDAVALPGGREIKNFFEANGFKARVLTVHRPLGLHPGRGYRHRPLG